MVHCGLLGVVRKQLGLSFLGETQDAGQMILGLVEVQGLGKEVRIGIRGVYRNEPTHLLHSTGTNGEKLCSAREQ